MQFCSLDRIWAREVAHLLSACKSYSETVSSRCTIVLVFRHLELWRSFKSLCTFLWIAAGESWHSWQPSFSGRTLRWVGEIPSKDQGQREGSSPSTQRVSLDDSAPTWSIPFAQCENIEDLWLSSFPVGQVGLALNNTGKDMAWMHDMVSGFGLLLEKRIWTQQPWQKKSV